MPIMTFAEYSRYRGVSKEAVSKAIREGRITTIMHEGKAKLDSDKADAEWEANSNAAMRSHSGPQGARKKAEASQPPDGETIQDDAPGSRVPSLNTSRSIKEAYNARIAKLDYEEKAGKMVPIEEVRNRAFKMGRIVRDSILNIPDRLSSQLAHETDEHKIHVMLTEELTKALEELSNAAERL